MNSEKVLMANKLFEDSFSVNKNAVQFDEVNERYITKSSDSMNISYKELVNHFWIGFLKAWEIQSKRMPRP